MNNQKIPTTQAELKKLQKQRAARPAVPAVAVIHQNGGGGGQSSAPVWGKITGTLGNQTDLAAAMSLKADKIPLFAPQYSAIPAPVNLASGTVVHYDTSKSPRVISGVYPAGMILDLDSDFNMFGGASDDGVRHVWGYAKIDETGNAFEFTDIIYDSASDVNNGWVGVDANGNRIVNERITDVFSGNWEYIGENVSIEDWDWDTDWQTVTYVPAGYKNLSDVDAAAREADDLARDALTRVSQEQAGRENADNDLQTQIDAMQGQTRRFFVDFDAEFSTDTPTIGQTDAWLAARTPALSPNVGTAFKNSNSEQATYNHLFVYYVDPLDSESLILSDDGVDTVSTASASSLGVVRGAGDVSVDLNGDMHVDETWLSGKLDTAVGEHNADAAAHSSLFAAKQNRSPIDGKVYGLQDAGLVPLGGVATQYANSVEMAGSFAVDNNTATIEQEFFDLNDVFNINWDGALLRFDKNNSPDSMTAMSNDFTLRTYTFNVLTRTVTRTGAASLRETFANKSTYPIAPASPNDSIIPIMKTLRLGCYRFYNDLAANYFGDLPAVTGWCNLFLQKPNDDIVHSYMLLVVNNRWFIGGIAGDVFSSPWFEIATVGNLDSIIAGSQGVLKSADLGIPITDTSTANTNPFFQSAEPAGLTLQVNLITHAVILNGYARVGANFTGGWQIPQIAIPNIYLPPSATKQHVMLNFTLTNNTYTRVQPAVGYIICPTNPGLGGATNILLRIPAPITAGAYNEVFFDTSWNY
jgi:hypothetical protein